MKIGDVLKVNEMLHNLLEWEKSGVVIRPTLLQYRDIAREKLRILSEEISNGRVVEAGARNAKADADMLKQIINICEKLLLDSRGTEKKAVEVLEVDFSDTSWQDVDKTKLPAGCFLYVPDVSKRSTWKLPYREGAGEIGEDGMYKKVGSINKGAIRALLALAGGARGGVKGIPADELNDIWNMVRELAKKAKVGEPVKEGVEAVLEFYSKEFTDVLESENEDYTNVKFILESLTEGDLSLDSDKHNADVTLVVEGWSKNGNYWTKQAVKDIAELAMGRRKMFIDHEMDNKKPRSIKDWGGQILGTSVKEVNGRLHAKANVHIFKKPHEWLWERMEAFPQEIGTSVDAKVKGKQGEMEGKRGNIVEAAVGLGSSDFVAHASAGGKLDKVYEAEFSGEEELKSVIDIAEGLIADYLVNKENKQELNREYWQIQDGLRVVLSAIANAVGLNDTEKKKKVGEALDDFKDLVLKINVKAFSTTTGEESDVKIETKKVTKEVGMGMEKDKLLEMVRDKYDLVKLFPEFVISLQEDAIEEYKTSEDGKRVKEEVEKLRDENTKLAADLDTYKVKEAEANLVKVVEEEIKVSGLEARHVTESFRALLLKTSDVEVRKGLILDRLSVIQEALGTGKVKGNGQHVKETVKPGGEPTVTDEKAIQILHKKV